METLDNKGIGIREKLTQHGREINRHIMAVHTSRWHGTFLVAVEHAVAIVPFVPSVRNEQQCHGMSVMIVLIVCVCVCVKRRVVAMKVIISRWKSNHFLGTIFAVSNCQDLRKNGKVDPRLCSIDLTL
jgi:hypothetical protein